MASNKCDPPSPEQTLSPTISNHITVNCKIKVCSLSSRGLSCLQKLYKGLRANVVNIDCVFKCYKYHHYNR